MNGNQNAVNIRMEQIQNICFIVMPFDSLFQNQYERVIKPAVEEIGFSCIRGDEIYERPRIVDDIWKSIRSSRLVIAELTGKNPNVLYEVGLAHAIGKPVIIMTRNEEDVPFDLKSLRYLYYDTNDPYWGENLKKALMLLIKNIVKENELNTYLEGIVPVSGFVYPELPISGYSHIDLDENIPIVSGNWKGTWKREVGKIDHVGTLILFQEENKVTGMMNITYIKTGNLTIVQETLTGVVMKNEITLNGVSYTYVQRGNSNFYNLDNFNLELSSDVTNMEGDFYSKRGKGRAFFNEIENDTEYE